MGGPPRRSDGTAVPPVGKGRWWHAHRLRSLAPGGHEHPQRILSVLAVARGNGYVGCVNETV